jgi:hypothetical protein
MTTVGISYQIRQDIRNGGFTIAAAYAVSYDDGAGYIRAPQTWQFLYPAVDGLPRTGTFNASEILGLLGGAPNRREELLSEAFERALGDVLTTYFCESLDFFIKSDSALLLVSGVAFPKLIGRVLSLRPPENVAIAWIWPQPFLSWTTQGVTETILRDSLRYGLGAQWEDEPLLRSHQITPKSGFSPLVVQQLCLWGVSKPFDDSVLHLAKQPIENSFLPRELAVSLGLCEVQIAGQQPYSELVQEEPLRPLPERYPHDEYIQSDEQREEKRHLAPPGWGVLWRK